jgi:ankyrin repeat protein
VQAAELCCSAGVINAETFVHMLIFFTCSQDGSSPLHMVSAVGNVELLKALLEKGANVETKNRVSMAQKM